MQIFAKRLNLVVFSLALALLLGACQTAGTGQSGKRVQYGANNCGCGGP